MDIGISIVGVAPISSPSPERIPHMSLTAVAPFACDHKRGQAGFG
jgi:hypothetical protein